jgi:hypothetical protein
MDIWKCWQMDVAEERRDCAPRAPPKSHANYTGMPPWFGAKIDYMKAVMKTDQIWFPAKKYGWGWGWPCAWQGWVTFAIFVVLLCVSSSLLLPSGHTGLFVISAFILASLFFVVCIIKGEEPRWRWGEKSEARFAAERLAELEDLRQCGLISDSEYQTKRQELLAQI